MNKLRNYIQRRPISTTAIAVLIVIIALFNVHINITSDDLINGIFKEAIFAAIAVFLVYIVAGKSEVAFSTKGLGYAFKKSWWLLTIPFLLGAGLTAISLIAKYPFGGNPFLLLFLTALDALSTGVFEESTMRGLVFNALLSKEGGSYKGIFIAITLSSIIFGFIHVAPDFFSSFPNISLNAALQMIGKTLESGMLGFLLAAIYVKNHNLWNIAIIHSINDFFLIAPANLFKLDTPSGYVQSSGVTSNGLTYYVMALLSIPFIITAIKVVKDTQLPQYGFFKEKWYPLSVSNQKKEV